MKRVLRLDLFVSVISIGICKFVVGKLDDSPRRVLFVSYESHVGTVGVDYCMLMAGRRSVGDWEQIWCTMGTNMEYGFGGA